MREELFVIESEDKVVLGVLAAPAGALVGSQDVRVIERENLVVIRVGQLVQEDMCRAPAAAVLSPARRPG